MDDIYLKEAIGAINTYILMINDHTQTLCGKKIIENKWYFYIKENTLITTLIVYEQEKEIKFFEIEWKGTKANMLGNPKLEDLLNELISKY
ncbi:hypothetical protein QA612_19335 [Evansella sp. AB-P1]|uniref:hypothetical protein n=1 Tax=Evansella sp. AB-P1 TaxID=3037653 RepID=UPI00241ED5E3|nr:hypothetical protein [Evansella sp. AB-P1]MDG5789615.1 hypothetical protein [Evansella sp. AB-P1]